MNVSELRSFATRHLVRLLADTPATRPPVDKPARPAPRPTMSLDRWGTILDVGAARVGDRFVLGRLRFRSDEGVETTYLVERGHTYLSFNWLDDRGVWQRKRAAFHELKPGMRAEIWGEAGSAETILVEGLPRVTA